LHFVVLFCFDKNNNKITAPGDMLYQHIAKAVIPSRSWGEQTQEFANFTLLLLLLHMVIHYMYAMMEVKFVFILSYLQLRNHLFVQIILENVNSLKILLFRLSMF